MPVPVSVIAAGGLPVVNTPLGTPMTPVAGALTAIPVTIVTDVANIGGIPVHLVNEDLTSSTAGQPELSALFVAGGAGWTVTNEDATHIVTFGAGSCRFQSDTTTPVLQVNRNGILTTGKTYEVIVVCSAHVSGAIKSDAFTGAPILAAGQGTVTVRVVATSAHFTFTRNTANVDLTLAGISIKEVPA